MHNTIKTKYSHKTPKTSRCYHHLDGRKQGEQWDTRQTWEENPKSPASTHSQSKNRARADRELPRIWFASEGKGLQGPAGLWVLYVESNKWTLSSKTMLHNTDKPLKAEFKFSRTGTIWGKERKGSDKNGCGEQSQEIWALSRPLK